MRSVAGKIFYPNEAGVKVQLSASPSGICTTHSCMPGLKVQWDVALEAEDSRRPGVGVFGSLRDRSRKKLPLAEMCKMEIQR